MGPFGGLYISLGYAKKTYFSQNPQIKMDRHVTVVKEVSHFH